MTMRAPVSVRRARHREVRDPYDGLRPWSAITHGAGGPFVGGGDGASAASGRPAGSGLLFAVF